MRSRKTSNGFMVNTIAGAYVIFFGMNLNAAARKGFRGFAFKREDHKTGEITWLRGLKTFETIEPHPAPGENFSTLEHPIQSFQWADYSVHPGYCYTYTIQCMYGEPGKLISKKKITIPIKAEVESGKTHSAFFNRGSVATQEYARRFLNKPPDIAGPGAYEWLSRGLIEAIVAFIGRAKAGHSLHGAIYEFQFPAILNAIKLAKARGATIKIIYDDVETVDKDGDAAGPWEKNIEAVGDAGIKTITRGRKNAKLMHNKFLVLSDGNKPVAVLTGSTNITENGIFGHANVAHIVENPAIVEAYKNYYERLLADPDIDNDYRDANMVATPVPQALKNGTTPIFSPRRTALDALNWYAELAAGAQDALLMTFAFGMHEKFKEVYRAEGQKLKMSLMEKAYASPLVKERDEADIKAIRKRPNVVVAIGNRIVTNAFDRWLKEMYSVDGKGKHVYWIHTKFMLIDPLGDEPIIATGSANFSKASTDTNDENMIVIKGDKRISDIYFGEYMRLYTHYAFREAVQWALENKKLGKPENWTPQYLIDDDKWMDDYFSPADTSGRRLRREYFSGPMAE